MRKEPRQARSRATVEVIVRAGARVLADRGWAGFTTNEVAEVAGVSIGSIYQYFPDKRALTDAIRRHHLDDVLTVLRKAGQGGSLHQLIDDLVDGMIAVHSVDPALHRVLLDEVPGDAGAGSAHRAFEAEYLERYRAIVAMSGRGKGQAAGVVVQVLSSAMEGVIHGAARRGVLASPEIRRELVVMIRSYLVPGRR